MPSSAVPREIHEFSTCTMTNTSSTRLRSLDAFRGATVAAMILVNNPGSWSAIYPQLEHARWDGWTMTDFIFPFFLWIMGTAMTFSFARRKERGDSPGALMRHVVQRGITIIAIGLFLSGFPFGLVFGHTFSFSTMRIPGVLQRIGLCYLAAGAVVIHGGIRTQIVWSMTLLAAYWLALMLIPVPGFGAGALQPTGNLCWYVDSHLFAGHTWSGAPAPGFDPEGLLSTVPAIATTLLGALTGAWLRSAGTREEKTAWMFVAGEMMLLAGAVLDIWMPINKNLWTSSYVVFMGGWALVVFAVFYWLIDVKGYARWSQPAVIFGMNALALFVLSGVVARMLNLITVGRPEDGGMPLKAWLYATFCVPLGSPVNASLAFAIAFILVMYGVAWVMWKKRWFIKI
jgi:predicted acyltransferase